MRGGAGEKGGGEKGENESRDEEVDSRSGLMVEVAEKPSERVGASGLRLADDNEAGNENIVYFPTDKTNAYTLVCLYSPCTTCLDSLGEQH